MESPKSCLSNVVIMTSLDIKRFILPEDLFVWSSGAFRTQSGQRGFIWTSLQNISTASRIIKRDQRCPGMAHYRENIHDIIAIELDIDKSKLIDSDRSSFVNREKAPNTKRAWDSSSPTLCRQIGDLKQPLLESN